MAGWVARFLSRDAHEVWLVSGEVLASWDREALAAVAPHVPRIRASVQRLDLGGAFRPNRVLFDAAMQRAVFAATEQGCLCALYACQSLFDARREAERGHVRILGETVERARYEIRYEVACQACATRFRATEIIGGHIPEWRWGVSP